MSRGSQSMTSHNGSKPGLVLQGPGTPRDLWVLYQMPTGDQMGTVPLGDQGRGGLIFCCRCECGCQPGNARVPERNLSLDVLGGQWCASRDAVFATEPEKGEAAQWNRQTMHKLGEHAHTSRLGFGCSLGCLLVVSDGVLGILNLDQFCTEGFAL